MNNMSSQLVVGTQFFISHDCKGTRSLQLVHGICLFILRVNTTFIISWYMVIKLYYYPKMQMQGCIIMHTLSSSRQHQRSTISGAEASIELGVGTL